MGLPRPRRRDQDARSRSPACAGPAWSSARPWSCCARRVRAGRHHRRARRDRRGQHPLVGRDAVVPGLPRLPRLDLRLGQRRGRARHPGRPGPRRRRRRLHRLRRHRRRLARRRRDHRRGRRGARRGHRADAGHRGGHVARHRRRPPRRPGHRHLARGGVRTCAAQGDYGILEDYVGHGIGTEMHQPPNVPNFGRPGRGPEAGPRAWRSPSSRWSPSAARRPSVLDDDWTVVTADGSWAAHFEHTFTLTADRRLGAHRARRRRGRRSTALGVARSAGRAEGCPDARACPRESMAAFRRGVFPRRWCRQYGPEPLRTRCHRLEVRAEETSGDPTGEPARRSAVHSGGEHVDRIHG